MSDYTVCDFINDSYFNADPEYALIKDCGDYVDLVFEGSVEECMSFAEHNAVHSNMRLVTFQDAIRLCNQ